jgi:hypothetical protein
VGNFSQWYRSRPVRRLTWVCGTELTFAQEVISAHAAAFAQVTFLAAGTPEQSEPRIWDVILTEPGEPWLVVVEHAGRLGQFESALAAALPQGRSVLFRADEPDFPQVRDEDSGKLVLAPHLRIFRDSPQGQFIRCAPPDGEADWLADWAGQRLGAGKALGSYLLARTGGQPAAIAAIADKINLSQLPVTRETIAALTDGHAAVSFAEALIAGNTTAALAAGLAPDEIGPAIGLLSSRLSVLAVLHDAGASRMSARDVSVKTGIGTYLQRRYGQAARRYSPSRVASCQAVLAASEDAYRSGVTQGLPEFLALLWGA